ncbi:MAG TPA: hypothetical protein VMB49_20255 [Acidobacteriaceae bacterium]|nr:hypothetical protein [Acidobacteriaceae bacterium]
MKRIASKLCSSVAAAVLLVFALGTFAQDAAPQKETKITPEQTKELFRSLNQILSFASDDTQLPIRHEVKRRLITREQVEKYILDKFHEDKDAKRMQREEIVLKKFGLLDRDFQLQTFLVSLLKEQIAGYYDNKTKTVNLLDWVSPEEQKPVMAHELTHALQDQHTDLDKWEPDEPDTISKDVAEDNQRLATDERDTARDAVLEGQAMAVYLDYILKPKGKSLLTSPDVMRVPEEDLDTSGSSPVMDRAPLLLQQSLLFPYRDGLGFEQRLLKDKGAQYAFAGVLDRPPSTSYEIMNPGAYERKATVPLLVMPDVHPLLDADYRPYDVGVMGMLDVRILSELFGGPDMAAVLTPQWKGGLYYAVQSRKAVTPEQQASTASVALLYLSAWRSEAAAKEFARMYADELSKKYSNVTRDKAAEVTVDEHIYNGSEGPVLIVRQGTQVFISESFDLTTAHKLQFLFFGAQQDGENQQAARATVPTDELNAHMTKFIASCGLMKASLLH